MASLKILWKNIPYIWQQLNALLGNTSPSVKTICLVVLVGHFLSYWDDAVNLVSVTPGYLIPPSFRVWTALTFCFLEMHFWEVCVDLVTVGLCGKLIEPLWGQLEMVVFFFVVNLGVALLTTAFYLFLYMCTFNVDLLFFVHVHGLAGYIAGLSVAVKQAMPDQLLLRTPLGKLTNRSVPLCLVLLSLGLYAFGMLEGTNPAMLIAGVLVSWTYLRFYQRHSNGSRGDLADNFSFASFFPNVLQPAISVISNMVYSALVKAGLCRRTVRKFDMSTAPTGVTVTLPGNDPHDMERRRQIALKALNERLSKSDALRGASGHSSQAVPTPPQQKETAIQISPPSDDPTAPLLPNQVKTTAQVHHVIDT
ncbi:transmembrane protein 115 [Cimex lectularius]|uniref:Transmembrane protein 115 n=1 Tax=Cimex lectularius TaxID=79782 RepID=A0A8I6SAV1_CIMLE|nr:transmembrane protein 115 [Cimex lectularius]